MFRMRYMGLNVFFLHFMSMYPAGDKAGSFIKFLLYFWRFVCLLGLGSLAILCLLDIWFRDGFVFIDISSNVLNTGIFVGGIIRISCYYYFDHKSKFIVERMHAIFRDESETGMEREEKMKSYKFFCNGLTLYWAVVVFFTGEFTALLPLAFLHKTGRTLPIQAWYPYDWKADGYYEFTMFTQALTQFFMGFAYGNSDMFYVCALYLTTGQFKLLEWEMKNVVFTALLDSGMDQQRVLAFSKTFNDIGAEGRMDDTEDGTSKKPSKEYSDILETIRSEDFAPVLKRRFAICINTHQQLLEFSATLDDFFSPVLVPCLCTGLFYTIFIPFTLLVTTDTSAFMGLVEYLVTALVEVFLMAFFGQVLTNQCEKLKDALYTAPWYLCNNNILNTFKFVQVRASKPVVARAGQYFVMGLDLFLAICKTSASYFAVLRQVTE